MHDVSIHNHSLKLYTATDLKVRGLVTAVSSETSTGSTSPGRAHFSEVVARPREKGAGIGVWKTISNKRKETGLKRYRAMRQSHCWLTVMVVV
jgi:hypothetical protein